MSFELTWDDCRVRALSLQIEDGARVYGIPNGGIPAATLLPRVRLVENPSDADYLVDDIIDSGETRSKYSHYNVPFMALVDKKGKDSNLAGKWVSFPWERMKHETGPEDAVRRLLQFIGEDPEREGLLKTPERVVKSFKHIFGGYGQDPKDVITIFENECYDEMIVVQNIEFYSTCEHHMQPFFGKAHIAYIPKAKIVGVSKLVRILEIFSRRLQIQERLTQNITSAIDKHLDPRGAACVLEAQHFCMVCRGVEKQNSKMITSSLTGVFREPEVRQEFLSIIK